MCKGCQLVDHTSISLLNQSSYFSIITLPSLNSNLSHWQPEYAAAAEAESVHLQARPTGGTTIMPGIVALPFYLTIDSSSVVPR